MPTGYTSEIHDGKPVTFADFARTCARGFGAFIHQRDEAGPNRHRGVSPHHKRSEVAARAELDRLRSLTPEDAGQAYKVYIREALAEDNRRGCERVALSNRYAEMAAQVEAWTPPTPEHVELKRFMLQQLRESQGFDCGTYEIPRSANAEEWHALRVAEAERDIAYHEREHAAEVERVAKANAWIDALEASLPKPGQE